MSYQPVLVHNSKSLVFAEDVTAIVYHPVLVGPTNINYDGTINETLVQRVDVNVAVAFRMITTSPKNSSPDLNFKRQFEQAYSGMQRGEAFVFARDSQDMIKTNLNGAAAVDDKTVTLDSVTGIVTNREYVIRSATTYELVKVESISGSVVTLQETLNQAHVDNAVFRSKERWDGLLLTRNMPFTLRPARHYDIGWVFREVVT